MKKWMLALFLIWHVENIGDFTSWTGDDGTIHEQYGNFQENLETRIHQISKKAKSIQVIILNANDERTTDAELIWSEEVPESQDAKDRALCPECYKQGDKKP